MATSKPNIVLIVADQWRWDCLGFLNSRHPVMTPHLNQLAAEGAYFPQAFADCPICMPVRATLLTGQTASHFGIIDNFAGKTRTPVDSVRSLPARLAREAGYQTKAIGKMHFNPERARFGFEHISLHPNDYVNWLEENGMGGLYRGHGLGGNEVYPVVSAVPERYTHTHWIVDESIRFLSQRDPDNPFFLFMVFEAPHSPFDPPEPYDRMYYNFTIPEPVIGDWVENEYPPALQEKRWERKYDQLNHDMLMEARRHYYGQISYIDYQLARFFGELKKKGLYDNTLIVFTADHGESLGDHGQFDKYTFLNCACRVPLIMTLPASLLERNLKAATENPVMLADICPTLMVAAGIEPDSTCDGSAMLVEEFKEPQASPRVICEETPESVYAVNGLWKYIYYFHGGVEQLFSIQKDPDDLHNLAGDPGLSGEKDLLKQALIHYLKQCNRPCVSEDGFLYQPIHLNEMESRKKNPAAWRGPLRYGEGY